jgi:hypothetical protein
MMRIGCPPLCFQPITKSLYRNHVQGEFLEIREDYVEDELALKGGAEPVRTQIDPAHTEAQREEVQQESKEDTDFEALMARLDELEAAERAGNQETWAAAGESDESQRRGPAEGSQEGRRGEGEPTAESQQESPMGVNGQGKQKRVRFVQEEPGGPPVESQGRPRDGERRAGGEKKSVARAMLGQVVERMEGRAGGDGRQAGRAGAAATSLPGEPRDEGGREEAAEAAVGPADSGDGEKGDEEGSDGEEGDRQFFETLRVENDEGSSGDEEEEEEGGAESGEEDEEEAGPSLETGRQVRRIGEGTREAAQDETGNRDGDAPLVLFVERGSCAVGESRS